MKDLSTGASLIQGLNKGHVYEWQSSSSPNKPIHAFYTTKSTMSQSLWGTWAEDWPDIPEPAGFRAKSLWGSWAGLAD